MKCATTMAVAAQVRCEKATDRAIDQPLKYREVQIASWPAKHFSHAPSGFASHGAFLSSHVSRSYHLFSGVLSEGSTTAYTIAINAQAVP